MTTIKILGCFLLGLVVFSASFTGLITWIDFIDPPNWLRYLLAVPGLTISLWGGWSMWRQAMHELNIEPD